MCKQQFLEYFSVESCKSCASKVKGEKCNDFDECSRMELDYFEKGFNSAKEEYEEKLRWISPNIKPQLLDENSIFSENVSIRVENGEYEYSGYYNFKKRQWLIYPNEEPFEFQLIVGWRYFL